MESKPKTLEGLKKSFGERVILAQNEIKVPKNQYNKFGKYRYRSAEDILESVKPVLLKYGLYLTIRDDIITVGNRVYVKAIAELHDTDSDNILEVTAFAREPEDKKGMDAPQITGTASSYSRKYALNGLFCLDDTKDADTDEYHNQTNQQYQRPQYQENTQPTGRTVAETPVSPLLEVPTRIQLDSLYELAKQKGFTQAQVWKAGRVKSEEQMTMRHYMAVFERLQKLPDVRQGNLNL